jgi:hypothetical protein
MGQLKQIFLVVLGVLLNIKNDLGKMFWLPAERPTEVVEFSFDFTPQNKRHWREFVIWSSLSGYQIHGVAE